MRRKVFWTALFVLGAILAFSVGAWAANPGSNRQPSSVEPSKNDVTVTIPSHAQEISPGVFYLGTAIHEGEIVEGYAFIHPYKAFGKPGGCNEDGKCQGWEDPDCVDCQGGGGGDDSKCYGFLAREAKWKTIEPYIVNPANTEDLSSGFVTGNLALDIDKWENAAGVDILGGGDSTNDPLEADEDSPDGLNEVYFADVDYPGAIAITIVWGIWGGPPPGRKIVEWDQVYDQVDFDWSDNGEPDKMDFENIATHELGHSVGMGDLYETRCAEQTMYGYADYGEIKKRTLEAGDIAGVSKLYE